MTTLAHPGALALYPAVATRCRDLIQDVSEMLSYGETAAGICQRCKWSAGAISRTLYRCGRADLARPFEAEYKRLKQMRRSRP